VGRRYVVDENSKPVAVLLDIQEYERMVEELEEFEDILARRAYDEAKAELERGEDELIPWEQAKREIEEERKEAEERRECRNSSLEAEFAKA
jgi:hypothetical protein